MPHWNHTSFLLTQPATNREVSEMAAFRLWKTRTVNYKDTSLFTRTFCVMAGTAVFAAIRVCRESGSKRIILQLALRFLFAIFKYGAGSVCLLLAGTRPSRLANTLLYKLCKPTRPPLWSSGQSFWLQIQRSRVRFPALPDFLSGSGSGTGCTQPPEVN